MRYRYGGMENPCLTFVTPTIISGDRTLATVVQHEITHSWTGNLVTNASWEHFWLNEGFTRFIERKLIALYNKSELHRHFECLEGWRDLTHAVK
jgi:leukotriene-A4 hydrolase